MTDLIVINSNKNITIVASEEELASVPEWFSEVALIAQLWTQSGLVSSLNEEVRVARGRMGRYEVVDFTLVLLAFGVSEELTLNVFFNKLSGFKLAMAALWARDKSPTASALSRFLGDVTNQTVEAARNLLFQDLLRNGIKLEHIGGLYDRTANRHILFDIDATKDAARQRRVPTSPDYPPVRRRRSNYAPGYSGRKRGEVVRCRTTVQQAHTQEWLGTFGAAGNGDIWGELEQSCQFIKVYMQFHSLSPTQAVVRLDGAYGWPRAVIIFQTAGIGYLGRCCDYRLLDLPEVKLKLSICTCVEFEQPDSAKLRHLYDLGTINWNGGKDKSINVKTRLIVACSDAPRDGSKPSVGKLQGNKVYELFTTDRREDQMTASDLLSLYFARGGFEQTLSLEDQEQDPDRFCSQNQAGQEYWQIISQWIWNARLRLGFVANNPEVRRTLWAEAILIDKPQAQTDNGVVSTQQSPQCETIEIEKPVEANSSTEESLSLAEQIHQPIAQKPLALIEQISQSVCESIEIERQVEANEESLLANNQIKSEHCSNKSTPTPSEILDGRIKMAKASRNAMGKFAADKFLLQTDGTLKCPADKILKAVERRKENEITRIVYQARISDCRNCAMAQDCRIDTSTIRGRRVSLLLERSGIESAPIASADFNGDQNLDAHNYNFQSNCTIGSNPLFWDDLSALSLRRFLPDLLRSQQIEIKTAGLPLPTSLSLLSRDQRAHRRLTWAKRLKRNAALKFSSQWEFHLHGIPSKITDYLNNISSIAA